MRYVLAPIALTLFSAAAAGFDPPSDVQGSITATLEAPETVTAVEQPVPVRFLVKNSAATSISGSARLSVIDGWRVAPLDERPVEIPSGETVSLDYSVTPDKDTYRALYPLHGYFQFTEGGNEMTAHPVHIVRADVPAPVSVEKRRGWRAVRVAPDSTLHLTRLPMYRAALAVFGESPEVLGVNWHGSEARTRAAISTGSSPPLPETRPAIGIHPPWYEGRAGTAWLEYPLALPESGPMSLSFATAIRRRAEHEPPGDGVTFRVRVASFDAPAGELGEIVFERRSAESAWQEATVDLSAFAGRALRLQFESHPGPRNDTTCDLSFWADPVVTAGDPARMPPVAATRTIGTLDLAGQPCDVRIGLGARGLLDGAVAFVAGSRTLSFGGFGVTVRGADLSEPGAAELVGVSESGEPQSLVLRHHFRDGALSYELVVRFTVRQGALQVSLALENGPPGAPWDAVYIEDAHVKSWSVLARNVYAGVGNILVNPQAFQLGFDGHQLATSFVGFDFEGAISMIQAVDVPPDKLEVTPADRIYALHAPLDHTVTFIPCLDVWTGVRIWRELDARVAAPAVASLAGRFVFDLWSGRYEPTRRQLDRAFRYGMTDSAVIWHNWQRWGYDYRLPDIHPPNPEFGTVEEFKALAEICARNGVLFAPHDNYIDFYPDADGYSYDRVAFTGDGSPIMAWFNEGRKAQSYRWNPESFRPFLERNVKRMTEYVVPSAYFVDVWSSIGPGESWTRGGRLITRVATRDAWAAAFDWIRDCLRGAPQISESGHDQLIGHLDGAQCNHLRAGDPRPEAPWAVWNVKMDDGERIPWLDAAYHDRFALHGAGYEMRYRAGLPPETHGIYSDDYVSSEMLTGHPAMAPQAFSRDAVRKYWLLHNLGRALAMQRLERVEFQDGDIHRQHVVWSDGDVWVNRGRPDWTVAGRILPQYGFYARIGNAEGGIESRNGLTVEWSRGDTGLFLNARGHEIEAYGAWTNGACKLAAGAGAVTVTPLPDSAEMRVRFSVAGPTRAEALDETGAVVGTGELVESDRGLTLTCRPDVFAYRVGAQ